MKKIWRLVFWCLTGLAAVAAERNRSQDRVIAIVTSVEDNLLDRRFYMNNVDAPYGWEKTVVAKIIYPESLAGREIAFPYDTVNPEKDPLSQVGARIIFTHWMNLTELQNRTNRIGRNPIEFPRLGLTVVAIREQALAPARVYQGGTRPAASPR